MVSPILTGFCDRDLKRRHHVPERRLPCDAEDHGQDAGRREQRNADIREKIELKKQEDQ